MQALLRLSALLTMLCCCWAMLRHAPRGDTLRLQRTSRRLRGLTIASGVFLALWLMGLVRH